MKKVNQILILLLVIVGFNANAQNTTPPDNVWQLKKEENGVKFYAKVDSCSGSTQPYFKLRIENTGIIPVKVSFTLTPLDLPASAPVYGTVENLAAGAIVESDCADQNNKLKVALLPPATTIADVILLVKIE
jgi:hypothetical protein